MIRVVADASVLVGELLRRRGQALFRNPELSVLVAQDQWEEAEHELDGRLDVLESKGLGTDRRERLEHDVRLLIDQGAIAIVPREHYESLRVTAARRVPRDERDWPTVAAALAHEAAILTTDHDFLGCGVATWTVETLLAELESS